MTSPREREQRPTMEALDPENQPGGLTTILPSRPAIVMHAVDRAWFDGYSSGMDVGHSLGFNAGHVVGWDLGFEAGRHDALAEADAAQAAELDVHNRWIARTIPQAVEARARRAAVSA